MREELRGGFDRAQVFEVEFEESEVELGSASGLLHIANYLLDAFLRPTGNLDSGMMDR